MLPSPIISNSASGEIIGGLQTQFGTVDYASFQSVRVPFYSYNTYPVAGVSVLNFFGSIAGQPSITTQDTNIPKAGSFGQSHFLLKSIGMDIRIGNDPFSTFDGTDASTLASRDPDGRRERVEERKRREGGNADCHDLTEIRLLRVQDEHRDERNDEALNQILEHGG